jgi:peptidoglycan/xylan/chitin deacetylase (PgdA/CDA1 family)
VATILIGGGLAAAAFTAGWASMWPTSQLYGATFTGLPAGTRKLALTYDDGPNDPYTQQLLEVLDRHQVRATFFMIGRYVLAKPQVARAVAQAGHEIGNHTYTHPNLIFCSRMQVKEQIGACERALEDVIGTRAMLFRPPYGGRRPDVLRACRRAGLAAVMWRATSRDWALPTAEAIVDKVLRQIYGGEVILMHDGSDRQMGADRGKTVAATDALVRRLKADGYEFATVGEMMAGASTTRAGFAP